MAVVCVMAAAVGAEAKNLVALEEQPPTGGELRLATPHRVTPGDPTQNGVAEVAVFPLKHTSVKGDVQGTMASVAVEQTVENPFHIDGEFQFVYPMVVGPRYLPQTHNDPRPVGSHRADAVAPSGPAVSIPYVAPSSRPATDIEMRVTLDAAVVLSKVESPTHQIVQEAATDRIPNKDFVLRFTGAGAAPQVGMLTHRAASDGFFTLLGAHRRSARRSHRPLCPAKTPRSTATVPGLRLRQGQQGFEVGHGCKPGGCGQRARAVCGDTAQREGGAGQL